MSVCLVSHNVESQNSRNLALQDPVHEHGTTEKCRFMGKEVREKLRVAPPRAFPLSPFNFQEPISKYYPNIFTPEYMEQLWFSHSWFQPLLVGERVELRAHDRWKSSLCPKLHRCYYDPSYCVLRVVYKSSQDTVFRALSWVLLKSHISRQCLQGTNDINKSQDSILRHMQTARW